MLDMLVHQRVQGMMTSRIPRNISSSVARFMVDEQSILILESIFMHFSMDSKLTKVDLDMGFSPSKYQTYIIWVVHLVGGFNHFEKYEIVNGKDYPIII